MDELQQAQRYGGSITPPDVKAPIPSPREWESPTGRRFELRDPFAEVTHRSSSFSEMVAMAEQLGAIRFVAVDPDGNRVRVIKDRGQWIEPPAASHLSRAAAVSPPRSTSNAEPELRAVADAAAKTNSIDARAAKLERELNDRYDVRRPPWRISDVTLGTTEYRYRGDTSRVAFIESGSKLSAEANNPSVIRSMIDVAELRHWRAIRLSGSDEFKRLAWIEASLRNLRTVSYEPSVADRDRLRLAQQSHGNIRGLATREAQDSAPPTKQSGRGGSRKAVLAAIEAILVAKRIPPHQREAVMAAAAESLARRVRNGDRLRVKVYDRSAPPQRLATAPLREVQRARERPSPSR